MPSILSLPYSRQLISLLEKAYDKPVSVTFTPGGILSLTVTARNCSNREGLTGGVVVETRTPPNKIKANGRVFTGRLRPDWTEQQFTNLFDRVWTTAAKAMALDRLRCLALDIAEQWAKSQAVPQDARETLAAWAKENTSTLYYDDMSVEDCDKIVEYVKQEMIK